MGEHHALGADEPPCKARLELGLRHVLPAVERRLAIHFPPPDDADYVKRLMNARAVSATSRQPLSMVSAWPRPGIWTISVTPSFRFWRLNEALAIAQGTVWSSSPETMRSGPRSGFLLSTFASVHGLRFAVGRLEERRARGGDGERLVQLLRLVLAHGVGEPVPELVVGERHRAIPVGGVSEHRERRLERRDRKRKDAAEGRGIDRHRDGGKTSPGEDLGQEAAERVADDRGLSVEVTDDRLEVVGDLADGLVREDVGVRVRLLDGLRVVGPTRRHGRVARLAEHRRPAVPAAREEPQPVDEHDRRPARAVCLFDRRGLVRRDRRLGRHAYLLRAGLSR